MAKKILELTETTVPAKTLFIPAVPTGGGIGSEVRFTIENLFGHIPIQIFTQQSTPVAAADVVKMWAQDYIAGDTRLYLQSESGNPIVLGKNEFQLYNTADIITNYERIYLKWDSNIFKIGTEKGGGGTQREINLIPKNYVEVTGQIKITGGVPGAGKLLTSDAAGLGTWEVVVGQFIYDTDYRCYVG